MGDNMIDKTFGEKFDGKTYHDRKGAYLICIKGDMAAVVKTPKGYFLIGGGIEENETHAECIKRETIEEIGFSSNINGYLASAEEYRIHKQWGYFHPIQFYYYGEIIEKILEPLETDHELKWISTENIEEKMYVKAQAWAIKQYLIKNMK